MYDHYNKNEPKKVVRAWASAELGAMAGMKLGIWFGPWGAALGGFGGAVAGGVTWLWLGE